MKHRRDFGICALAGCLLASTTGVLTAPVAAAVKVREIISAEDAEKHVGQTVTVCSVVASTRFADSTSTKLTYLNLGRAYPDQLATVVIPNQLRSLYRFRPEEYYKGKRICVAGAITMYHEKPQIVIDDPFQIRIDTAITPSTTPADEATGE